ncbi:heavy-metal-associated domain-containing protein [Limibacter armeniacum]|uniref:heavy-metal-associated domain-containing protein n=1 Tax=Limibacter armeniacum TaxID=466084 RepID=UPI002FE50924
MKPILAIVMLIGLLAGTALGQDKKKVETLTVQTSILCDHCLQCGSCGANITDEIYRNKGIKKVTVDPAKQTITVIYKPDKTTPDGIRQSIAAAGFDADDVKAETAAYEQLDGCCKNEE